MPNLFLFLLLTICVSLAAAASLPWECQTGNFYTDVGAWKRASRYTTGRDDRTFCDSALRPGWFRFQHDPNAEVYADMPDSTNGPTESWQCNTYYPIYLKGIDPYPKTLGESVTAELCVFSSKSPCVPNPTKKDVNITNCGNFNVYYLSKPPEVCPIAYCFGVNVTKPLEVTTAPPPDTTTVVNVTVNDTAIVVPPPTKNPIVEANETHLAVHIDEFYPSVTTYIIGEWVIRSYNKTHLIAKEILSFNINVIVLHPTKRYSHFVRLDRFGDFRSLTADVNMKASAAGGGRYAKWAHKSFYKGDSIEDKGKHHQTDDCRKPHRIWHIALLATLGCLLAVALITVTAVCLRKRAVITNVGPTDAGGEGSSPPAYEEIEALKKAPL